MYEEPEELTELHHHEALHMANAVYTIFENELVGHPAVYMIPERKKLAQEISEKMMDLYQLIPNTK